MQDTFPSRLQLVRSALPTHQSLAFKKKNPSDPLTAGTNYLTGDWDSAIFHEICLVPGKYLKYVVISAFLPSFGMNVCVCVGGGVAGV